MKTQIVHGIALAALLAPVLPAQEQHDHAHGDDAPGTRRPAPPPIPQLRTGAPNEWFERTKLFMGEFLDQETVTGKFAFKNPTGKVVTWKHLTGSCQCARAEIKVGDRTYELSKQPNANSLHRIVVEDGKTTKERIEHLNIEPGEKGEIEVFMEMGGLQGYKDATLAITTSDPAMKQTTLTWQAKGVKLFQITPSEVFLNNMTWIDKKKFKFVIESPIKPDFKLLDHDPLPEYVTVEKKQIELPNGHKAWEVSGMFGPNADPKAGGTAIRFNTDWEGKEIRLTVIATITPPVTIEPGTFLSFGKIAKGKGAVRKITFTPNGDFELALEDVKFPKLTIDEKYISAVPEKEGKNLIVAVRIAPEVEGPILIRGSIELKLSHPSLGTKTFNFNGILR